MRNLSFLLFFLCLTDHAIAQSKWPAKHQDRLNTGFSSGATSRGGNSGLTVSTPARGPAVDAVTRIVFMGPKQGWGFAKNGCPYFSAQGKSLGHLPGGMLFKYTDVKASSRNPMLVSVLRRNEMWEGPYLIDCTEVAAYEGDPDTLAPGLVKNLGAYFSVDGKISERKAALDEIAFAANPAFKTARDTRQAYQASIVKATEMNAQASTLTGARKAKADDDLRAFKYEQVRLKAKADASAAAYKAWKAARPVDTDIYAKDTDLQALEQERTALHSKLGDLVPPENP